MPRSASGASRLPWWAWILIGDALLIALIVSGPYLPRERVSMRVLSWFALQNEMNLAVWWSGAQLLLGALLMYERASLGPASERWAWAILAFISAGLSFDEIGSIHERLGHRSWKPLLLVAVPLGSALVWALVRLARKPDHRREAGLVLVAYGLFGVVALLEYFESVAKWSIPWRRGQDLEESIELVGFFLLLLVAAGHRRGAWGDLRSVIPSPGRLLSLRGLLNLGLVLHAVIVLLVNPRLWDLHGRGDPGAWYPFAVYGLLACQTITAREGAAPSERRVWTWLGAIWLLSSVNAIFVLVNLAIDIHLVLPRWVYTGGNTTYVLLILPASLLALRALGWQHRVLRRVIVAVTVLFLIVRLPGRIWWLDAMLPGLVAYLWTLVFMPPAASGGHEIEPSVEHGHRYLDATRVWADRFRRGGS